MREVYVERRRRGFFGWLFLLVFIGWNLAMLAWLLYFASLTFNLSPPDVEGEEAARNIGRAIGGGIILFVWACGSIVTGLAALLTRGSKRVIRRVQDPKF